MFVVIRPFRYHSASSRRQHDRTDTSSFRWPETAHHNFIKCLLIWCCFVF
jgi:hypothetical protein